MPHVDLLLRRGEAAIWQGETGAYGVSLARNRIFECTRYRPQAVHNKPTDAVKCCTC